MVLGLIASVVLARGSLLKAMGMIVMGLLFGHIGTDVNSGTQRDTFGVRELMDGIGSVTVAMGMFGLGEIILNLDREGKAERVVSRITSLMPTREDGSRMVGPILRGTVLGSFLGILPGGGSLLASFAAYSVEKGWLQAFSMVIFAPSIAFRKTLGSDETFPTILTALAARISSPRLAGVGPKKMQKALPGGQYPSSPAVTTSLAPFSCLALTGMLK